MSPIVEVQNVKREYHKNGNIIIALNDISLKVEKGEFLAILGPSGSGKSTLLNIIGGLDRPNAGKILIEGFNLSDMTDGELVKVRSNKIGFVFQYYNLLPQLSAIKNVELPLIIQGFLEEESSKRAEEILSLLGLGSRLMHYPSELSGGEQQRVAIARALIHQPAIVLADEPTGNLDEVNGNEIIQIMRRLNDDRNQTFIIATHDIEIARSSDRIIYLQEGLVKKEEKGRETKR
jgi:putative ABC transport system ATP-binding protein